MKKFESLKIVKRHASGNDYQVDLPIVAYFFCPHQNLNFEYLSHPTVIFPALVLFKCPRNTKNKTIKTLWYFLVP